MSSKNFDDIFDECLTMLETGVSIDDCIAPYPDHADELRAQLQTAKTLTEARPHVQPEPAAMARNRSRLLTAVAQEQQTAGPTPILGFLAARARRFALLPYALPVVLAVLFAVGGLTAAAAVLQPDVPVLRSVFGASSVSSPPSASPTAFEATETPDGENGSSANSPNGEALPSFEFEAGTCEVRGLISSLGPLVINGITIDDSNPEEVEGDLAQAMADGAFVSVEGTADGGICVAREINVDDEESFVPIGEPRTDFEAGTCEVRGLITNLNPLVISGITIDDSNPEEVDGDLAQAMAARTFVKVEGISDGNVCIARKINVEDDEEDEQPDADEDTSPDADEDTSPDADEDSGSDADEDTSPDADEDSGSDVDEDSGSDADEDSSAEVEGDECEVRGLISSLEPLVVNGITIDASSPDEVNGDLAQAMADGTEVRVKGTVDSNVCVAREINVEES